MVTVNGPQEKTPPNRCDGVLLNAILNQDDAIKSITNYMRETVNIWNYVVRGFIEMTPILVVLRRFIAT